MTTTPDNAPLSPGKTAEHRRLDATRRGQRDWLRWGPYLSERAWATVREDYGTAGHLWDHFSHEQAAIRAYRWNEDGLAGFSDEQQLLCFALGLWNGKDDRLKERLFGLTGPEGNHGEDVKEHYWYLDSTPTHSFCRMRYRYPQRAFPYAELRKVNAERDHGDREYELTDTGIFAERAWFDVNVTYAKAADDDLLIEIAVHNAAGQAAELSLVPQLWFRNTWSWSDNAEGAGDGEATGSLPSISAGEQRSLVANHPELGRYHLYWQQSPAAMFTNNETNAERLFGSSNRTPWVKDAFHRTIVDGEANAVNPDATGTKAGLHYRLSIEAGATVTTRLRLTANERQRPFNGFAALLERRQREADAFYASVQPAELGAHERQVQRQAFAGMLWSKQFFHYDVATWYRGDDERSLPRLNQRNVHWQHMRAADVLSMPDKWEYPWFAVWDTAFHCLPLSMVDMGFAQQQLLLMLTERYQHPNGQLPAYENALNDVNPPVHAWATLEIYRQQQRREGKADREFLEQAFHKLVINFSWWINRRGRDGSRLFDGGFLGMDNISLFDRSAEIPMNGRLEQADATAWMALFAGCMANMALELAQKNASYQALAIQYIDHYVHIAAALNGRGNEPGLWHEEEGFFFDRLVLPDGRSFDLQVRSYVGLMAIAASTTLDGQLLAALPGVRAYLAQLRREQPALAEAMVIGKSPAETGVTALSAASSAPQDTDFAGSSAEPVQSGSDVHLTLIAEDRLRRLLSYLLDEQEFLSAGGIRSLSRAHADTPVSLQTDDGQTLTVGYEPGEGMTDLFGGNSNWRGPVWFPINYLLIDALRCLQDNHGPDFTVALPTGDARQATLGEVADELSQRLVDLFRPDTEGHVPWTGDDALLADACREGLHQFPEYFHGDTGRGLGATHQTGWTGLVACLLDQQAERQSARPLPDPSPKDSAKPSSRG